MGIGSRQIEPHWNYFLALDEDLAHLSRYVEFNTKNFDTFSLEIARVLLAAAAEMDVVGKQLCDQVRPGCGAASINAYRDIIREAIPEIPPFQVVIPRFGLELVPWDEWKEAEGVPYWWTAYNKVKHHRHTHFERASLKHALNAVGALLVLLLYLYKDRATRGDLVPSPDLVRAGPDHIGGFTVGDPDGGVRYKLEAR